MSKLLVIMAMAVAVSAARAQETVPSFEVVSVRINRSNAEGQSMRLLPGGRALVTNAPLRRLVLTAYGLLPQQLLGGPDWIDSTRFDIIAQASENLFPTGPDGRPGTAQIAFQRLLAERFRLAVHTETRELPIYELTLARGDGALGPRMSPAKVDCDARMEVYGRGGGSMPSLSECGGSQGPGGVRMRGASMANFARSIVGWTDRMVHDRTSLSGGFDLELEFTPGSGTAGNASPPDATGSSLFTALEEQLGLKLRSARARVDVLVIDHAALPTED